MLTKCSILWLGYILIFALKASIIKNKTTAAGRGGSATSRDRLSSIQDLGQDPKSY